MESSENAEVERREAPPQKEIILDEEPVCRPPNPTSQFEIEKPESPICFEAEAKLDLTETTELEISQEQELSQAENVSKISSVSPSPMPSETNGNSLLFHSFN